MRSEAGIIEIYCDGFYLAVFPIKSGNRRYWTGKITNKHKRVVKEFLDINPEFVKLKALEWEGIVKPPFKKLVS